MAKFQAPVVLVTLVVLVCRKDYVCRAFRSVVLFLFFFSFPMVEEQNIKKFFLNFFECIVTQLYLLYVCTEHQPNRQELSSKVHVSGYLTISCSSYSKHLNS